MPLSYLMGTDRKKDEIMNYAVVSSEELSTGEKLEKYTGEIQWAYLKPHFEAGSLLWLSPELSITEVGEAITGDDSERVQDWRKEGLLIVPSTPHADYWESTAAAFRALVVSPFVLIQPLEDGES